MTRAQLLASIAAAAGVALSNSSIAAVPHDDGQAYEAALAKGAMGLESFLSQSMASPLASDALVQLAQMGTDIRPWICDEWVLLRFPACHDNSALPSC